MQYIHNWHIFFYIPIIVSSPSLSFYPEKIIIIMRHYENLRITLCSLFYYYYICMCTLLRTTEFFGGSRGRLIFRSLVSGTRLGYNNLLLLFLLPLELESQRCQNTTKTTQSVLVMRCLFSNDYFSHYSQKKFREKSIINWVLL